MIFITLCPNCHTLQQAGRACSICRYPVQIPHVRPEKEECDHREVSHETPCVRDE